MFLQVVAVFILLLLTRMYVILSNPSPKPRKRNDGETCVLAVFLGSGGHTSEALTLISGLDFSRYARRIYIVSEGDTLSPDKAVSLEHSKTRSHSIPVSDGRKDYEIVMIPRARRVHQTMYTVLPTFMRSVLACIYLVTAAPLLKDGFGMPFADVLILNGPGTCVTLSAAVMVNKLLGLPHPKMIYVESYARVHSLSLSGKIMRYFVDRGRACYQAVDVRNVTDACGRYESQIMMDPDSLLGIIPDLGDMVVRLRESWSNISTEPCELKGFCSTYRDMLLWLSMWL